MKYVFDIRIPVLVFLSVLTLFSLAVTEYIQSVLIESEQELARLEAQRELTVIRSSLEAEIYSDIFYANSLATLISVNPNSTNEELEKISKELINRAANLRHVGVAPDEIIRFVYPFEGNEKAIGLDFRTVPEQWRTVQLSRERKSIFIAGPVHLVQGGLGLIARSPVFTDPPKNETYWGSCSIVLDLDSLFVNAGVNELEKKYDFAIRGLDGQGKSGAVFYGDERVFEKELAFESVHLPSGSWYMAVSSSGLRYSNSWYYRYSPRLIGYPSLILVVGLISVIYLLYRYAHTHSLHDELTKLPNRRYFIYALEQAISESEKQSSQFTLLNLDLNHFKSINDTYGHALGDEVLKVVAKRIKSVIRKSDLVARVGGDEFLILLPRLTDELKVNQIIQELRQAISSQPVNAKYRNVFPHVSIGYVIYMDSSVDVDTLLHAADLEMYRDKEHQRKEDKGL